jgi:hypothetical protein
VHDQPFDGYSLARATSRWLGEYDALLIDEARRKLWAVYTATVDEEGQAISRVFAASRDL